MSLLSLPLPLSINVVLILFVLLGLVMIGIKLLNNEINKTSKYSKFAKNVGRKVTIIKIVLVTIFAIVVWKKVK